MEKKPKKIIAMCLALSMSLVAGGCGSPAPSEGQPQENNGGQTPPAAENFEKGPLVIGTYGGKYDEAFTSAVINEFKEKYQVDVILDPSYSFAKLAAEGETPSVDLALMDDLQVAQGKDMNVFLPLDLSRLPNAAELYDAAIDPTGLGVSIQWGRYGIAYRTDMIPEAPTSWSDLWKEEYAGHVTMNTLLGTAGVQLLSIAAELNGGNDSNLEPGWEAFKELAANSKAIAQSTANLTDMLTTGEVWIAPWWDGRTYALAEEGVPVAFVVPEEGAFNTNIEMVITKNTANPNLAYAFLNMMLDAEAQAEMSSIIHYGPVNKNSVLDEALAAQVVYGEEQANQLKKCDWEVLAPIKSELSAKFDREIAPLTGTNLN